MKEEITITLFFYAGVIFAVNAARADAWVDLLYLAVAPVFFYCGVEWLLKTIEKRIAALKPGAAPPAPGTGAASTP